MTRGLASWAIALAAASLATLASPSRSEESWLTSYADAQKLAAKEKKIVLMDFTGSDWCGWCIKLKQEVFSKPEFAEWAKKNVVLLEVDFPRGTQPPDDVKKQNDELLKKFKVEGFPTIVFVNAEGKEVGRTGYLEGGPAAWLKEADGLLQKKPADAKLGDAKPADAKGAEGWLTNYDEALKAAKKDGKVMIADFTGSDWCGYCIKLKANVFDKTEFKEWAAKNAVLLELDFPRQKPQSVELKKQNLDLKAKHKVSGFPTILFLNEHGKVLGKIVGYEGDTAADWIKKANKAMGRKV